MQSVIEIRFEGYDVERATMETFRRGALGWRVLGLTARLGGEVRNVRVLLPVGPGDATRADQDHLMHLMLRHALSGVEADFQTGLYGFDSAEPIERVLADNLADLESIELSGKRCQWTETGQSGPECRATLRGQTKITTVSACRECVVADDRLRCADFVHPRTQADPATPFRRQLTSALCDSGECMHEQPSAFCDPMRSVQSCWKRRVSLGSDLGEVPSDIGARVIDEIDYFTIAYRQAHFSRREHPWPIPQARSIQACFDPCTDQKDFLLRSAALADFMDKLSAPKQYPVENGANLAAFVAFVETEYPSVVDDAQWLRKIHALRNQHPIHSQGKEVGAFAALGLHYPPDSWDAAWRQVLARFHQSLRNLRQAIQTGAEAPAT